MNKRKPAKQWAAGPSIQRAHRWNQIDPGSVKLTDFVTLSRAAQLCNTTAHLLHREMQREVRRPPGYTKYRLGIDYIYCEKYFLNWRSIASIYGLRDNTP